MRDLHTMKAADQKAIAAQLPAHEAAYAELEAMGAPVIDLQDEGAHFRISGERNGEDENATVWADYYLEFPMDYLDDFGVHKDIIAVLSKHGLDAQWANPGYLNVYTA